jgi:hypothetical protein
LAKGVGKRYGFLAESVKSGRMNMGIPQRGDGVESLLIRAIPEDIWHPGIHVVILHPKW